MNISKLPLFLSSLGKFWQNRVYSLFFRWNIFLLSLQFLYLFYFYSRLPSQVPLYFSEPWGDSWLVPTPLIFFIPSFSLLIVLINSIIALLIQRQWPLLARLLLAFSLVFAILSSVSLYHIVNLAL